ncbi:hypothetical protein FNV43_RR02571 [Rhamnella rubrinervis]|uniref:BHLH domain-containing protein n=1 Tax=Rhamnella rubrinervis TaxID=2594499 RepID=A0A8K0MU22_9ROSA|nr:hypothetical protein FNV43_RR02571 [Rhamnella rubrinervis]
MMATGNPNWWNINNMRPPTHHHQPSSSSSSSSSSPFLPPPSNFFPQFAAPTSSSSSTSSWHDHNQELPESWSQLLLGGLVGEEDKSGMLSQFHHQVKKFENWEDHEQQQQQQQQQQMLISQPQNASVVDVKQEHSPPSSYVYGHGGHEEFHQAAKPANSSAWSHQIMAAAANNNSSPKSSCVTSFSSNMLDFTNTNPPSADHHHHLRHPRRIDHLSTPATGGTPLKKARVQPSSTQSTFKVRKEKLGDRITALHQLVSPFGKTDTASVLLEAIGYIRFLQSQIEALSLPYLGSGSGNMRQQQSVHENRNCMFPEDPGQLLNDNCMKRKGASDQQDCHEEPKKDLRSRGLCLVPVSCTLQVGSDNGADYWAPALGGGGFR